MVTRMNELTAASTYFKIANIWRGRSTAKISVFRAMAELKRARNACALDSKLRTRIKALLRDIIENAYAPDEEAMAS